MLAFEGELAHLPRSLILALWEAFERLDLLDSQRPAQLRVAAAYARSILADGQHLRWQTLPLRKGLESVSVVGGRYRSDVIQDQCFAPGNEIVLQREPTNQYDPNAWAGASIPRRRAWGECDACASSFRFLGVGSSFLRKKPSQARKKPPARRP